MRPDRHKSPLYIRFFLIFLATSSSAIAKEYPSRISTEALYKSCAVATQSDKNFSDSFCLAYIAGFFQGYASGLLTAIPYMSAPERSQPGHNSICIDTQLSEHALTKDFLEWIDSIPDPGKKESFMQLPASQGFYSYLRSRFNCSDENKK